MRRAGFTLTELLVTIAIIGLLMAISIPSLHSSRQQTNSALCSSNIKQLVFGLIVYETENETFPHAFDNTPIEPPPCGYPGSSMHDRMGWWWFNYIGSGCGKSKKKVLKCPSKSLGNLRLENNILCGNYGVNRSICKSSSGRESYLEFIGTPLSTTDIFRPGQTMLLVDSGYSMITWWHATNAPPVALDDTTIKDTAYIPGLKINAERDLWPGQEWDAINGRHLNKRVNVGFVDCHMNRMKADDLFVEENSGSYINLSPLWLPE